MDHTEIVDKETHKEFIRSLSHVDRDRLGSLCGVSGSYITSLVYRKHDSCSLAVAAAIDRFSGGKFDFRELMRREEAVDWHYIAKKLGQAGISAEP